VSGKNIFPVKKEAPLTLTLSHGERELCGYLALSLEWEHGIRESPLPLGEG